MAVILRIQVAVIAVVAAEQLIAAVAAEHDLHAIARERTHMPGAERKRVGGLIQVIDDVRQKRQQRRGQRAFVVFGAEQPRDGARMGRFVETLVRNADGEGGQVFHAHALGEHRDEQARVESAAQ